jgi:predicted protein tyrosine phosphatase
MIDSVDFVSLDVFEELVPAPDMVAISIGDPAQLPPSNLGAFAGALRVEFLDLEPADLVQLRVPREALCSFELVQSIIDFVRTWNGGRQHYRLVVHCRMGSSRSAAVALLAHAMTLCEFPRRADAHYANAHVVKLAARALFLPIEIPQKLVGDEPHPYLPSQLQI